MKIPPRSVEDMLCAGNSVSIFRIENFQYFKWLFWKFQSENLAQIVKKINKKNGKFFKGTLYQIFGKKLFFTNKNFFKIFFQHQHLEQMCIKKTKIFQNFWKVWEFF